MNFDRYNCFRLLQGHIKDGALSEEGEKCRAAVARELRELADDLELADVWTIEAECGLHGPEGITLLGARYRSKRSKMENAS